MIAMVVSTMPVSVALRTVVLQATELEGIDEQRDFPVPELPQTAKLTFSGSY